MLTATRYPTPTTTAELEALRDRLLEAWYAGAPLSIHLNQVGVTLTLGSDRAYYGGRIGQPLRVAWDSVGCSSRREHRQVMADWTSTELALVNAYARAIGVCEQILTASHNWGMLHLQMALDDIANAVTPAGDELAALRARLAQLEAAAAHPQGAGA